jgi:aspartate kinase
VTDEPLVIKFGGTSIGEGAAFLRAASIAAGTAQDRPLVTVVSAMSGPTDVLLKLAEATINHSASASTGTTHDEALAELYRSLADRHLQAAREAVPEELFPKVENRLWSILEQLMEAIGAPLDDPAAHRDAVASFGERLSAEILNGAVKGFGLSTAVVLDDPIATNDDFGEAEVLAEETRQRTQRYVRPLLDASFVAVVPGYLGRTLDGAVTTLGREGSDLSATALGRALCSREVWIMSDVDGVLEADPRLIPEAGPIRYLSYREATRFATLGAKVLHPRTVAPAAARNIEVCVRNTFNPNCSGTRISGHEGEPGVRGVVLCRGLSLTHVSPEATGEDVFCVLGVDAKGQKVLMESAPADVAAVVCIGAPTDEDLLTGLRCLREAGIRPLFAGNTSKGLVFTINDGIAETALRTLHTGLVSVVAADAKEVA